MLKLTKAQSRLFNELAEAPNDWAACEGHHERRTANSLKRAGLVDIDDSLGGNWFDCRLTDAGRALRASQGSETDG